MDLSRFSDEELIEEWAFSLSSQEAIETFFEAYSAEATLPYRTEIHKRDLEKHPKVIEADKKLIQYALKEKPYPPVITNDYEPPLDYWWWHIDKIGEKTYPADLLPEHLKEIYLKAF
jgi:hypothetical protein